MYDTNIITRQYIDKRLEKINSLHATLGTDSTEDEKLEVRQQQIKLWHEIKSVDEDFYNRYYEPQS